MTGDIEPEELSEFPLLGVVKWKSMALSSRRKALMMKDQVGTRMQKSRRSLKETDLAMVDRQADLKEVTRLIEMGVLRKPAEGEEVEKHTHLTTKVVRDWRRRPGWTRRSRLVAREFQEQAPLGPKRCSPRRQIWGRCIASWSGLCRPGLRVVSLDIKDAYLQVPQPSPAVITVDAKVFGNDQEGQVTYVLERLLPGQRVGASAWYNFAKQMLEESGMENFPKEPTLFRSGSTSEKVGNDPACRRRAPGFVKEGNVSGS